MRTKPKSNHTRHATVCQFLALQLNSQFGQPPEKTAKLVRASP